jgi:hypothetical protein
VNPQPQCVQVGGSHHPKTANVFLGLRYGQSMMSTFPVGCNRSDLALLAGRRPPTKTLTPAAFISSLSASFSRPIASSDETAAPLFSVR